MEVSGYRIRPFEEVDRAAALALGQHVLDWWNAQCPTLHLVAAPAEGGDIIAHLQIADRSLPEPSRHKGKCQLRLTVAPAHRNRGLGGALYARAEAFARLREADCITAAYLDAPENAPAAAFMTRRGFEPFERYHPSKLDLTAFDPDRFSEAVAKVERRGFRLFTYAEIADTPESRRRLFELECAARATQPFREVGDFVPPSFEEWEPEMAQWTKETIFLAAEPEQGRWVGLISSLLWGFTGVHPQWQGQGVATALKVRSLAAAKAQGMTEMETENHEDNKAMLAVNRKLGFVFGPQEVNCMKRL